MKLASPEATNNHKQKITRPVTVPLDFMSSERDGADCEWVLNLWHDTFIVLTGAVVTPSALTVQCLDYRPQSLSTRFAYSHQKPM